MFGKMVLVGAVMAGAYALFVFDPSVPTGTGARVNNIGLMQDRQNLLIASCAAAFVGCILMVFGGRAGTLNRSSFGYTPGSSTEYGNRLTGTLDSEQLKPLEAFRDALIRDDAIVVRQMLTDGVVRAYQELPTGRGFLQFAVKINAVNCIPLLLASGADVNQRDSMGKTALDFSDEATLEVQTSLSPPPPVPAIYAGAQSEKAGITSQLEQLASLHAKGILTIEEFALAKGRVLA